MPWTHDFNPRSRKGNDADVVETKTGVGIFQSTFPIQGTTSMIDLALGGHKFQSTFPIQGTTHRRCRQNANKDISIHVPYTGNDSEASRVSSNLSFQSTFPIQGTTLPYFHNQTIHHISIHVPYTGNDGRLYQFWAGTGNFNPRSLYRERRFWYSS